LFFFGWGRTRDRVFGTRERAGKLKEGESFFFLNEREGNRKQTKETKRPSKR
jgi:hypothetical protein